MGGMASPSTRASPAPLAPHLPNTPLRVRLQFKLARAHLKNLDSFWLGIWACAFCLGVILMPQVSPYWLLTWTLPLILATVGSYALRWVLQEADPSPISTTAVFPFQAATASGGRAWMVMPLHWACITLAGSLMGLLSLTLGPWVPLPTQFMVAALMLACGILAIWTLSYNRGGFLLFITAQMGTFGVLSLSQWQNQTPWQAVAPYPALICLGLYAVLVLVGLKVHALLRRAFQLRLENDELVFSLQEKHRVTAQALQTKARMLSGAAHDLRQPLLALGLYADWLQNDLDMAAEITPKIVQATQAVHALFDAFLDLGRLEAGEVKAQLKPVELRSFLQACCLEHQPQAQQKGLQWRQYHSPHVPEQVITDPLLLKRIIGNLMANAVRHTPAGGVLLACRPHGGMIRIEIWDTGPGIAEAEQEKIFEEFYKVTAHSGTQAGFGLGLAIVQRLGHMLDVPIGFTSRPGRGSVFHVSLPQISPALRAK